LNEIVSFREALGFDGSLAVPADVRESASARLDEVIGSAPQGRSRGWLRPAIAAVLLLVLFAVAWATARAFDLHLFSSGAGPPVSATARAAFASYGGAVAGGIDLTTIEAAATFATSSGPVVVYIARFARGDGVATVYEIGGRFFGGCTYSPPPEWRGLTAAGCKDGSWSFTEISGVVDTRVAGVEMVAKDGTARPVPLHRRVFVYLVPDESCAGGTRPTELVARDRGGELIARAPTGC